MHNKSHISPVVRPEDFVDVLTGPAFFTGPDLMISHANRPAADLMWSLAGGGLTGRNLSGLVTSGQALAAEDLTDRSGTQIREDPTRVVMLGGSGGRQLFLQTPLRDDVMRLQGFLFQHVPDHADAPQPVSSDGHDSALAESEWRWKTAVLSANQGVWDHDFETDTHYVSPTWRSLRGMGPDDPIPASTEAWLKTIHPGDLEHIREQLRRLDEQETDIINYKFRQRHPDGHWVWFLSVGRVVRRDANGLPARIIGTDTDITDIKTVEAESRRMTERLDLAMDAAGMARWEFDVGGDFAFWDDRMLDMFGISGSENQVSSSRWATFIHPDDRDEIVALSEKCLAEERDIACDYRLLRPDGEVRVIRTRGKYVYEPDGNARYYGVNFDVTRDFERTSELEKARARLEHESRHDSLTGLANRRYLDEVYTKLTENGCCAKGEPGPAVMHFDIDHFKQINDTLGHDAGDATLRHAAGVLRNALPAGTLVSRVGGDEFVALFDTAPGEEDLRDIARRIIRDMSRPFHYGTHQCNIGTSIGIAICEEDAAADDNLFINADLALYVAKKAGRGRYNFYDADMKEEARRRKASFDALVAGFEQGEITCHYQPQFDAETLELTGLEALARWESPTHGLIMPDAFLDTAEDMGLLAQFDDLVLRKALSDLRDWEDQGLNVPGISVNVSSHRLNEPRLAETLAALDLPAGKLSFELLESAFLDSQNEIISSNLKMIEELGIDIEIDDFGSGHASIISLLQIAPKRLKIDRMLVQPVVASKRQRDLVRTIIGIGRMLDIRVVAEGVETEDHVRFLQEIGCCYLQGFGLARPMDTERLTGFLHRIAQNGGRLEPF